MLRSFLRLSASFTVALSICAPAQAQDVVSRDLYQERIVQENKISFCYNPFSMMSGFEQDLAQALGDALLTETALVSYQLGDLQMLPTEWDYRIPLVSDQIFVLLAQNCSAMLGYVVSTVVPEWMQVSRPYLVSEALLFSDDPSLRKVADLKGPVRVGVRLSAPGDAQLITYANANPNWKRVPYADNGKLIERVTDETNELGMMWSHGFHAANHALGGTLYPLESLPFNARAVQIGVATRVQDGYLNDLLSEAIAALEADGTLTALMVKHNMLPAQ